MMLYRTKNNPEVGESMSSYSMCYSFFFTIDGVFFVSNKKSKHGGFLSWNSPFIHFHADYDRYQRYFLVMVTTIGNVSVYL